MQSYTVYLYLETALCVLGGTSTHHQECKQLYLQYLVFVTPLLLPATHLILLDLVTRIIFDEECRSLSFSLCSFLHSRVTSSVLGPNSILSTLFSNTLSLRSSLNVSDQASYS